MRIIEKATERFALPAEALGGSRIILSGGCHLTIENHRGILEYSEDFILIAMKKGQLSVRGSALSLYAIDSESIVIGGKILSIELG